MTDTDVKVLRGQLVAAMTGSHAHVDFESVVKDFPADQRGNRPHGVPHSAWQLLEHMRIAQNDILEFSRNPKHVSPKWPDEYWPSEPEPPSATAWTKSVKAFRRDLQDMQELVQHQSSDLFQRFSHGEGETLLREALLIANHNSYHLGELMFLKRMLTGS